MQAFYHYLSGLKGRHVQLERGGPETCDGRLELVQADYLLLRCMDQSLIFFPFHHIRSVTPLPPPDPANDPDGPSEAVFSPVPSVWVELVQGLAGRVVRLYHTGPEMTIGTVAEVSEDHLLLEVEPGETVCFLLFHIRSLCVLTGRPEGSATQTPEPPQGR